MSQSPSPLPTNEPQAEMDDSAAESSSSAPSSPAPGSEPSRDGQADHSGELASALAALGQVIIDRVQRDPQVRAAVRGVLDQISRALASREDDDVDASAADDQRSVTASNATGSRPTTRSETAAGRAARSAEDVYANQPRTEVILEIGDERVPLVVPGVSSASHGIQGPTVVGYEPTQPTAPAYRDADLSLVMRRAALKAEAARWALTRRQLMDELVDFDAQIKPTDTALADRARAIDDCTLWMLSPYQQLPDDDASLACIAGCYETVAVAARHARELSEHEDAPLQELLHLAAEAQSMLRSALDDAGVRNDADQLDLFAWLRDQGRTRSIYISRYMKLEDPADPADWKDLQQRFEQMRSLHDEQQQRDRARKNILGTIRYEIKKARTDDPERIMHHWSRVNQSLAEWEQAGFAPSDRELVRLMAVAADEIPDELELLPAAQRVLSYVDGYLSNQEALRTQELAAASSSSSSADGNGTRATSPEVQQAAELLRGKVVVIIGGEQRRHSRENLQRELELRELRWVETSPHQPLDTPRAEITRPEVDLVLLAIRWSSHSFGELKNACDEYHKPFVRLPGGYSPNQVARQVLTQVSEQLA